MTFSFLYLEKWLLFFSQPRKPDQSLEHKSLEEKRRLSNEKLNNSMLQASDKWQAVKVDSLLSAFSCMLLGFRKCQSHTCCQPGLCWAELIESTSLAVIRDSKGGGIALKCLERKLQSPCNEHQCVSILTAFGGRTLGSSRAWDTFSPSLKAWAIFAIWGWMLIPGWWLDSLISVYSSFWSSMQSSWSKECTFS